MKLTQTDKVKLNSGAFIVFEGADACGKGTAAASFCSELNRQNVEFVHTREPGGTHLAEEFRRIALADHHEVVPSASRLMLMMAARMQLCSNVIVPALQCNYIVVCERYIPSTIVYQGILNDKKEQVTKFIEAAMQMYDFPIPDVCFHMDAPAVVANQRLASRERLDLFERDGMVKVIDAYRGLFLESYPLQAKETIWVDGSLHLSSMEETMHELAKTTVSKLTK